MKDFRLPPFTVVRTVVLFVGGMAGMAYQTVVEHADRPSLIVAFLTMLGLPIFLGKDESNAKAESVPREGEHTP